MSDRKYNPDDHVQLATGEERLKPSPSLVARLAKWGITDPMSFIPGFRVTYSELDHICQMMQDEGWSGFIGLDESIEASIPHARIRETGG